MNKVAVVILNYNSSQDCRKCTSYLDKQEGVDLEIIIVDNCSMKDDCLAVEELCSEKGYTFIKNQENKGYNAGNNIGLRYAVSNGYKYALIANPDIEFPQTDYISKLLSKIEENDDIVVCGSDIVTPEGIHQNPMFKDGNWKNSFGWVKEIFCKKKKSDTSDFIDNYKENHYCSKVSGCCFLIDLCFVQKINYFDENVFLYCEEAILSKQIEQSGKRMYYLSDNQALHAHIKSEKGNPVNRFKQWKRSRIYYIRNYSCDSKIGKLIAEISMRMYVFTFCLLYKIKRG